MRHLYRKTKFVTLVLGIFVFENYTSPLPCNDPEEMGRHNQTYFNLFKCVAKIHALECKANLINNYF